MRECEHNETKDHPICPSFACHNSKTCYFSQWDWACNLTPITMEMLANMRDANPNSPEVFKFRELMAKKIVGV